MSERHRSIVDVSLILWRDGRVLMLRRANASFANDMLCFPSGHLERDETVVEAMVREAGEEIGVRVDPAALRLAHVVHHTDEGVRGAGDRVGFFFEVDFEIDAVDGEPVNAEPHKHSELVWVDPHDLPADVVPYQAAGLLGHLDGTNLTLHGWD
ncbi:NUDIX domain-containing protein [Spongisporangium articulatum]|uniref:NUDIX domain-containing protein n=1 Tax=Spongisporangium articulatum TaxID=3362603 RepID=A0ABW8AU55_9ACTN